MAQWNGALSGSLYRNILAAIAIRTPMDVTPGPKQFWTSASLRELNNQEQLISNIQPPLWPEDILGKIDRDRASNGAKVYEQKCAACHEPNKLRRADGNEFWILKKFKPEEIGVDMQTTRSYRNRRLDVSSLFKTPPKTIKLAQIKYREIPGGNYGTDVIVEDETDFAEIEPKDFSIVNALNLSVNSVLNKAYKDQKITEQEMAQMKESYYEKNKQNGAFFAGDAPYIKSIPLEGAWATSPYLHNNSVLTLSLLI